MSLPEPVRDGPCNCGVIRLAALDAVQALWRASPVFERDPDLPPLAVITAFLDTVGDGMRGIYRHGIADNDDEDVSKMLLRLVWASMPRIRDLAQAPRHTRVVTPPVDDSDG